MPISNVNVQLGDTYDGASSDSLGYFAFVTYEKGKMFLKFSHINYKSVSVEINLDSSFQGMTSNQYLRLYLNHYFVENDLLF